MNVDRNDDSIISSYRYNWEPADPDNPNEIDEYFLAKAQSKVLKKTIKKWYKRAKKYMKSIKNDENKLNEFKKYIDSLVNELQIQDYELCR